MSKRESKGQRVKSFKHWIPQPDLSKKETQVVVYFKANEGAFYIYDGAHLIEACRDETDRWYETRHVTAHGAALRSKLMDNLIEGFEALCKRYEQLLREQGKKRCIRFSFARNRPYVEDSEHKPRSDISFCGHPAIHFDYELLWRVGDTLYRQDDPEDALQFAGHVARSSGLHGETETCVDWTPEREAFFSQMRSSLITLINRIDDFQSDLEKNVTLALQGGMSPLMIAASKEKAEA